MSYIHLMIKKSFMRFGISIIVIFVFSTIFLSNSHSTELLFVDKTSETGLSYSGSSFGLSWGDFDQDGWIDLYIRNHANQPSLYRNQGNGVFEDITLGSGIILSGDLHGASWGDFDNDGDLDLYQTLGSPDGGKVNYLYRNDNLVETFTDIAGSSGVTDPDGRGRTAVWLDYDLDGFLDLFIGNLSGTNSYNLLFHNNGNETFTDVTIGSGLENSEAGSASVGDYDNDGDLDLFLSEGLYRNEGDGTFTNFTVSAGLNGLTKIENLALGDYDNDGDLDLYLVRSNSGDAYISDTDMLQYALRISNNEEKGFDFSISASTVEFDIYLYGARIDPENVFIGSNSLNPGAIPFTLDSNSTTTHGIPLYSPGIDYGVFIWYDTSNNEWQIRHSIGASRSGFGVIVSSPGAMGQVLPVGLEIDTTPVPNQLFQNQGDGTFVDVTGQADVADLGQGQSAVWADFDNDGDIDLYVLNSGNILNEPNILYENLGNGTFLDITSVSGTEVLTEGRGESVAICDYDNDGFIDLLVLNGFGPLPFSNGPRVLLHNERTANHWLQIKLVGRISNQDAVGATVEIKAGALSIIKQQTGGVHSWAQNSQILQFGLATETLIDRVTIRWPSGIVQQLSNIAVDQSLVIEEPKVSLTLIPDASTIPRGGVLGIQVAATNYTNEALLFLFATNITLPNGSFYPSIQDPLYGPIWLTLAPGETRTEYITHDIPADAPLGEYIYNGFVGKGLWNLWNEDHFEFTITL